jgi:hypothetical protein
MFIEFAKASRLMDNAKMSQQRSEEIQWLKSGMEKVEKELNDGGVWGNLLSNGRTKESLFSMDI